MVKQGDLLFTIDRRPFQIALDQTRANLAQSRANLAFTEADLARGQELRANKTITEQTFDQRTQAKRVAEAVRRRAGGDGAVRPSSTSTNSPSCVRPIAGRIGDRRVSVGNLVTGGTGGNTTLLATIVSIDPIRFEFTFDEASYLRYERSPRPARTLPSRDGGVAVALKLIDENDFAHNGRMDFVDNVIDRSSGTIRGRAIFRNSDGLFTPGMFGRVRVPGSPPYEALLVPDAAIGTEQARKFVLVVDAENVARQKYVTLGQIVDGLRVIKDGLSADDRVVVNGLMRAAPRPEGDAQESRAPPQPARQGRRPGQGRLRPTRCAFRISSSTGRSSPPWSRSSS